MRYAPIYRGALDGGAEINNIVARGEIHASSGTFHGVVTIDTATPSEDAINLAYDGYSVGRIHTDEGRYTIEGPLSGPKIVLFNNAGTLQMTVHGDDVLSLSGDVINIFGIPISIGANDSGGTGYRVLRVPNG